MGNEPSKSKRKKVIKIGVNKILISAVFGLCKFLESFDCRGKFHGTFTQQILLRSNHLNLCNES